MLSPHRYPLASHALFHTRDVDQAREAVARVFCPHVLNPCGPITVLDARHHSAPVFRDVSLNYVQYGPAVDIEPGHLGSFYLLQIPLRGSAEVNCGGQHVMAGQGVASLPSPSEYLKMRWADDSPHLILRISQGAVVRQVEQMAQTAVHRPLVFGLGLALDTPALAPLGGFVRYLAEALEGDAGFAGSALAQQAEAYLLNVLLLQAPHNYSEALCADARRPLLPRAVRRAQEFMQANVKQTLTLADLCGHLHVSARSLQQAFVAHTGESPMVYWRNLRLDKVREVLHRAASQASAGVAVRQVASEHGFLHMGHFAAQYQRRFGELPVETLRTPSAVMQGSSLRT
jgi:AraC-like DNA-binding protein